MAYKLLPDLKDLATLRAVVELGGVNQAAKALNSQALHHIQINDLHIEMTLWIARNKADINHSIAKAFFDLFKGALIKLIKFKRICPWMDCIAEMQEHFL